MSKCMELLAIAATAIRDQYMGFPDGEIVAPSGMGMRTLLRDIVQYLRDNGVDDEGGWDCDATEGIKVERLPAFEPFKLIVEAYAVSEFGDGPAYAEITVRPLLMERLLDLSRLCEQEGLESITVSAGPDKWDREDELRIRGDSLRVFGDEFWFEAHPKHADYSVETRGIRIADLVAVASPAPVVGDTVNPSFRWSNSVLFYASDGIPADLIEMVEAKDNTCSECGDKVDRIIGCPDGAEVCQACFDNGAH